MAEDTLNERFKREQEKFRTLMRQEAQSLNDLPTEERLSGVKQIKFLQKQGKDALRQQGFLIKQGINPYEGQEEEDESESALTFILRSLGKPISAIAQSTEAVFEEDPTRKGELQSSAIKNLIPFFETATGERVPQSGFGEVLKTAGVPKGGQLSDVIPGIFSETGEGLPFKKEGLFDPTVRGTAGFAADVILDPTNLIGAGAVRAGAKGVATVAGKGFKKATGKTFREAAFDSAPIRKLAQGFNKYAFMTKDPSLQNQAFKILEEAAVKSERLKPEALEGLTKMFQDNKFLGDNEVFLKLQELDDLSTKISTRDGIEEAIMTFPDIAENVFSTGKANPDALKSAFLAQSGLTESQKAAFTATRDIYDDLGRIKATKGKVNIGGIKSPLVKSLFQGEGLEGLGRAFGEIRQNYTPRKMVNLQNINDLGQDYLETVAKQDPLARQVLEKVFPSEAELKAIGMDGVDLAKTVHGDVLNRSYALQRRVFRNYAESKKYAEIMKGEMVEDMGTLLYESVSGVKRNAIQKTLSNNLKTLFKGDVPKQVEKAFAATLRISDPLERTGALNRTWNKYFLKPLKYSLTIPFPAFHVRNVIDDTFRGYEKFGVKYADATASKDAFQAVMQGDHVVKLGEGVELTAENLWSRLTNMGVTKRKLIQSDIERNYTRLSKQLTKKDGATKVALKKAFTFLPLNEEFGLRFNNHARVKGALVSLKEIVKKKGYKNIDELADDDWLEAARASKDAFIDVSDLGPIDDALAQVIPFYRFSRKNIPFQVKTLLTNPQRISKLGIATNNMQADTLTNEDRQMLSPFLKDSLAISLGDDLNGNALLLSGLGLSVEEFNRFISTEGPADTLRKLTVGQAIPPLQWVYGMISNKHPFFGSELDDYRSRTTYKAFHDTPGLRELIGGVRKIPKGKDKDGNVQFRYELKDPKQYFTVTTLFSPFIVAAAARVPGVGAPALGALSPRGINTFGQLQDERKEAFVRGLKFVTGVGIHSQDLKANRLRKYIETYKEQSIDLRRETSRIKKFNKLGISFSAEDVED